MSSTGAIFTGNSQFSSSFQQEISRAVSFASLPMHQMQSDVATLTAKSTELSKLNNVFSSLGSALSSLSNAIGTGSYTSSSSLPAVANVAVSGTPLPGTFTVKVDAVGSYSSAMSADGLATVADPTKSGISDATSYTLSVGAGVSVAIHPTDTTLSSLVQAINDSSAGVQATVVNVGTNGATDYRLSIQDQKMEKVTIQLASLDGTSPNAALLSTQAEGAPTTYRVNGKPAADSDPLSTSVPDFTLAPGVAVTLTGAGTTTITVGRNADAVSNALSRFVSAYNAAQTEIDTNRGNGTGPLHGEAILSTLSGVLKRISGYTAGEGGISSLSSLGVEFADNTGALSFDTSKFATATQNGLTDLTSFLGGTTTGGFLKSINDAITGLTDPATGAINFDITATQDAINRENESISDEQARIDALTVSMNAKMAAADSAIAAMEQQYSYLSQMYAQMQSNSQNG
jgi:flagellar hook-associated protein 2